METGGFERERRPFSGHITIGRVREDRSRGRIREAVGAFAYDGAFQSVNNVTLMSSVLSSEGPTYTPVQTTKLG
jgi:2'-5' RNA ligase